MAHWPLWQSNGTKNTSFQESSPESSPVQNPGPVQGIVLPSRPSETHVGFRVNYMAMNMIKLQKTIGCLVQLISLHMERPWALHREIYCWCG